jgi:hypothetical protein
VLESVRVMGMSLGFSCPQSNCFALSLLSLTRVLTYVLRRSLRSFASGLHSRYIFDAMKYADSLASLCVYLDRLIARKRCVVCVSLSLHVSPTSLSHITCIRGGIHSLNRSIVSNIKRRRRGESPHLCEYLREFTPLLFHVNIYRTQFASSDDDDDILPQ